ncbi:GTP-binding protein [Paraclostridium bifermentans]|nr:GTP-binding protein [Paraclostridium bifermentans]
MAADCAVMVIDSAKGVEEQTKKLFHVCKMRGIPIFTFINKWTVKEKTHLNYLKTLENVLEFFVREKLA